MWAGQPGASGPPPWVAFLAGVVLVCPGGLPGIADGSWPRATDLLALAAAGWLTIAIIRSSVLHPAIRWIVLVWGLTLPWVFMEICALAGEPDPPVQRLLIRWILCGFAAYLVAAVADTPHLRARFLWGLLAGVVLSALTVLYDFMTFSPEDIPVDQLVTVAIYNGKDIHDFVWRAFGIFGHPNGAAGCVLVGVPVLIGMIHEGRAPRWSAVFAVALVGGIFYLTKSRGPFFVSIVLLAYWIWSEIPALRLPLVVAGGLAGIGFLTVGGSGEFGHEVLMERFLDFDAIAVNADDRWWTIATSLNLMLRHPLGMGSAYVEPLQIATGTSATHNAYLELGVMSGLPLLALVAIRLVKTAAWLFRAWRPVEAWLAAYLVGIFFFESYFLQVTIQALTLWLVISPLRSPHRRVLVRPPPSPRPLDELVQVRATRDATK